MIPERMSTLGDTLGAHPGHISSPLRTTLATQAWRSALPAVVELLLEFPEQGEFLLCVGRAIGIAIDRTQQIVRCRVIRIHG
jgi:hypothetical protein